MKSLMKKIISPMYKMIKYFYLRSQKGQISNKSININENGFLYIVTGEGYVQECLFSIKGNGLGYGFVAEWFGRTIPP